MVLIISRNNDRSTIQVIKWLSATGKKWIRIHEDDFFTIKAVKKRICLESRRTHFFLDEIQSVWYRRGGINFTRLFYRNPSVNIHMNEAQHWLEEYVIKTLESRKHINTLTHAHVNKLIVLEAAKKAGLLVPDYFLAENTEEVIPGKTIVKSITGNVILESINKHEDGIMYTTVIQEAEKEGFFISFFQEKIEKDFEIRSFYMNGKFRSMAIFSQNDEQTKTDLRKYNLDKPNRNVPYNLPSDIEKKAGLLMKSLGLNSGSLDFIKSGNLYYFLEVNPIGQFGNVSADCNYFLEKEIAEYL